MSYTNLPRDIGYPKQVLSCYSFQDASHLFTPTADQKYALGQILDLPDGRRFRYCKAGEALDKAKVVQAPAGTANWQDEIQTNNPGVPTAGDKEITVTLTATATKDQFEGAWLTVEQGTGYNELYLIEGNKAGTSNATSGYDVVLRLADEGGIRTAFAVTSNVTITLSSYNGVIEADADPTGVPVGVSYCDVTSAYYFWACSKGPAPVTCDDTDTIVVGDMVDVSADATIPGAIALADGDADDHVVGWCMRASATSETALIMLNIE